VRSEAARERQPGTPLFYGTLSVQGTDLGYGDLPFRLTGLKGEIAPRYVRYVA